MKIIVTGVALGLSAAACLARPAAAQERYLYWGDPHLHTSYSGDAYRWGNTTNDPETAYRFAKGLPVTHPGLGNRVRIDRPLDFLAITDHAPVGAGAPIDGPRDTREFQESAWALYVDAADRHYEPGVFTTFIGWEWTFQPNGSNLHRNIFTPTDAETAKRFLPITPREAPRPEDLWTWLEETSSRLGIDFVAIPHNPNISRGLMFDMVDSDGRPITAEYARTRMRWEPVAEVMQVKGGSETHPVLSPDDEFADFEIYGFVFGAGLDPIPAEPGGYLRSALLRGLMIEAAVGVNPYKYGLNAASDTHTGLSNVGSEEAFAGRYGNQAGPEGGRTAAPGIGDTPRGGIGWDSSAQGLTGVWSTANTREALTAAFKRKEVYGTSGPRIQLRVFGGFDFRPEDAYARDLAAVGYGGGVPMGGDLGRAPSNRAVSLLIHAVKDPLGANLDRVQVIKGWLDANGEANERVYDVAWAGERTPINGAVPAIGSTVDASLGTYENTIGAAQLSTVWVDPDFSPDERAFYYVRVLEIPTPRYTTYDALALGLDPEEVAEFARRPVTIQERAISSPIWYTP